MKIINNIKELRQKLIKYKVNNQKIGFVPTMGYLHKGHASLITLAKNDDNIVVVSIFVNPLQFGKNEDLDKYPKDLAMDSKLCEQYGVDILFIPDANEILGNNSNTILTSVNISTLDQNLCGAMRIGHFNGVCTIVSKLFNIVMPDRAYFGKKDIQQLRIIEKMTNDLNYPIDIIGGEIIRDVDGLALSSRNSYLNHTERTAATIVPNTLQYIITLITKDKIMQTMELITMANHFIKTEPLAKIDYIEIVDNTNLQHLETITNNAIIAIAIHIGQTRLIDNFIYTSCYSSIK
jgi:pantoate--beta-alanine ligase